MEIKNMLPSILKLFNRFSIRILFSLILFIMLHIVKIPLIDNIQFSESTYNVENVLVSFLSFTLYALTMYMIITHEETSLLKANMTCLTY